MVLTWQQITTLDKAERDGQLVFKERVQFRVEWLTEVGNWHLEKGLEAIKGEPA